MKILVIGLGSIGIRHAVNAAALGETRVFDLDLERCTIAAEAHGLEVCNSLDDAYAWGPDGVVIATPHFTHLDLARQAIDAGADVLIEKPIAHELDGVDAFLGRAESLGRSVYVVCNMRFHPAVATMYEGLKLVGRPLFVRAHYGNYLPNMRPDADYRKLYCAHRNQGGGVILDAIHEIDYLTWFFGQPTSVQCCADKLSDLDIDVEDYAEITVRHSSTVYSQIHLDYLRPFKRRGCEITGDKGILVWRSEGKNPEHCRVELFLTETGSWKTLLDTKSMDLAAPLRQVMTEFTKALNSENHQLLTGRQAAQEMALCLSALDASKTGQRLPMITLDES